MDLVSSTILSHYEETFTHFSYTSQKIKNKEFENCTFEKCIFIDCVFEACQFIDCNFTECSISATKPFNSQFINIGFKNSKVLAFDWTKAKSIRFLKFEGCDLSFSNFSFLKIPHLSLIDCIAQEVDFRDADLSESIFTKTNFSKTIFANTNLTKADFRNAFNYEIDFKFNILKKTKFSFPEAASLLNSLDIILE